MILTPEQLLAPRWEVIADYPYSPWEKGDILCADEEGELHGYNGSCGYPESSKKITIHAAEFHPAIFRQLYWAEKREIQDMPEYINWRNKHIHKVTKYGYTDRGIMHACFMHQDKLRSKPVSALLPATESEYLEYQKQKP